MSLATHTGDDPEPFDEQDFIRLLYVMEVRNPDFPDAANWNRLIAGARHLLAENIRLRNQAREAQQRVTLLEQGQQLLPLSTDHHNHA